MLETLELELQSPCVWWELNLDPAQEEQVL